MDTPERQQPEIRPKPPVASVLVYSGGDLAGDGLMKIPFLRALRRAYPEACITWLSGKGPTVYAGQLREITAGLIDEVVDTERFGRRYAELFGNPLPGRSFDLVIDTQRRLLTTLILRRVPHRIFVSGGLGYRLSDRRPGRHHTRRGKPPSMVQQLLDLVEAASGVPADPGGRLTLDPDLRQRARAVLPEGPIYIGLAPGAGGKHKCWPRARFIELAERQVVKGRCPVFILGPDETSWFEELRAAVPKARFPLQEETGGAASITFTVALAERFTAAVANDSGVSHMFAAADCPLVSLFGPTRVEKFAPLVSHSRVVSARDFGATAMDSIPLKAVDAALDSLLAE
jgi:ADP-heptose:LPS heptosyltransferase